MVRGRSFAIAAVLGFGLAFIATAARQARRLELRDCVVVVTGGGRGLGFVIAREFALKGACVAICGRDADEVARAANALRQLGADVMGLACDAANPADVEGFIARVMQRFGRIDVLINNAGQAYVGPSAELQAQQVEHAMRNIFWVQYHPTMAVLPHMRARRFGRIVNISSIGGKLPVSHMAAYAAAKHAITGWSQTLAVEMDKEGILISTVSPPPLRDGASWYSHFHGRKEKEFRWFAAACNLPVLSTTAQRSARVVLDAAQHGDAERAVTFFSWLAARANGVAPNAMLGVMRLIDRFLPAAPLPPSKPGSELGGDLLQRSHDDSIQTLGSITKEQIRAHQAAMV